MAGPTAPNAYPELCETSYRTIIGECPICRNDLADDWSIMHSACKRSFCADCVLTWVSHSETQHRAATCPMCRSSLGFLKDNTPMKTYIVTSLDELRSVERPVPWEDVDLENVDPESVKEFNVLEHVRNVLLQADRQGLHLNIWSSDLILKTALGGFEVTAAFEGQDQAVDAVLRNRWVIDQLHLRQQKAASEEALRLLFHLNGSCGVRYLEAWNFPDWDSHTTFYIPLVPALRVLGSITELRALVSARQAWSECNQTGAWLDNIFTADQLRCTFKLDTSDGQTCYLLDTLPQEYDLQGWAIFRTDDMEDDTMYAVSRAHFPTPKYPTTEPGTFFIGANGPEKMVTEEIDWNEIPAGLMETWIDLWEPDSP